MLNGSDSAEIGEEYFVQTPEGHCRRRYQPTTSKIDDESLDYANYRMEVDQTADHQDPNQGGEAAAFDRNNPPINADWWDMETLPKQKEEQEQRTRRLKTRLVKRYRSLG